MADATTLERLDAALGRIEAATVALRDRRDWAESRFDGLDRACGETIGALDRLIAESEREGSGGGDGEAG